MSSLNFKRVSNSLTAFAVGASMTFTLVACTPVDSKKASSEQTVEKSRPFKFEKLKPGEKDAFVAVDEKLEKITEIMRVMQNMAKDQSVSSSDVDIYGATAQGLSPEERSLQTTLASKCILRPHEAQKDSFNESSQKKLIVTHKLKSRSEVSGENCPIHFDQELNKVATVMSNSRDESVKNVKNSILVTGEELQKLYGMVQYSEVEDAKTLRGKKIRTSVIVESITKKTKLSLLRVNDTNIDVQIESNVVINHADAKSIGTDLLSVKNNTSILVEYNNVKYVLDISLDQSNKRELKVELNGEVVETPESLFLVRRVLRLP
jgi:hypothetical protein